MLHEQDKQTRAVADQLVALPVFSSLERRAVDALAAAGRVVHLPAHWALVSESQPADSCYVLLSGSTEVRRGGDVVAELAPGSLVGEAALVEHKTRNATVVTTSEVSALRLGFEELTALFGQFPAVEQVFRSEWDKRSAGV
jgi:CRP-like cAMP-binding protein